MGNEKRTNAWSAGLWSYGSEFVTTAADPLALYRKKNPVDPHYAPFAIYYNFAHGIELGLKSYLVHEPRASDKHLREVNHDLERLLCEALDNRLRCACTGLTDTDLVVIQFLSKNYKNKRFEYIHTGDNLEMMHIDEVAKTANALICGLEDLVYAPMAQQWNSLSDSEKKLERQDASKIQRGSPARPVTEDDRIVGQVAWVEPPSGPHDLRRDRKEGR